MARFTGKVTLVTGASSGLGAATALRLAAEGAQVFGIARNIDGLRNTEQRAQNTEGILTTMSIDVSQPLQCAQAVRACIAHYGRLDALTMSRVVTIFGIRHR